MAGEHLAISNYDDLSAEEIAAKIDHLAGQPDLTVDWQALYDYEKAGEGRSEILDKVTAYVDTTEAEAPVAEGQATSQPGPTPGADKGAK